MSFCTCSVHLSTCVLRQTGHMVLVSLSAPCTFWGYLSIPALFPCHLSGIPACTASLLVYTLDSHWCHSAEHTRTHTHKGSARFNAVLNISSLCPPALSLSPSFCRWWEFQWRAVSSTPPVGSVWAPETLTVDGVSFTMCKCHTCERSTLVCTDTCALFTCLNIVIVISIVIIFKLQPNLERILTFSK